MKLTSFQTSQVLNLKETDAYGFLHFAVAIGAATTEKIPHPSGRGKPFTAYELTDDALDKIQALVTALRSQVAAPMLLKPKADAKPVVAATVTPEPVATTADVVAAQSNEAATVEVAA